MSVFLAVSMRLYVCECVCVCHCLYSNQRFYRQIICDRRSMDDHRVAWGSWINKSVTIASAPQLMSYNYILCMCDIPIGCMNGAPI